jgi:acyl-CoA thioester hydrolase
LAERDRGVFAALEERGIPVAMAGGYGHDLAATVRGPADHVATRVGELASVEQSPPMSPSTATDRPQLEPRSAYRHFTNLTTRWMDNDVYGHVNNVVYYSWFDTVVNRYLIEASALDVECGDVIGLVVETHCNYFAPLAFPQTVDAGLRVGRVGMSSVRYELGLFAAGAAQTAARGHFVHVYVDRQTRRPVALPAALRQALGALE